MKNTVYKKYITTTFIVFLSIFLFSFGVDVFAYKNTASWLSPATNMNIFFDETVVSQGDLSDDNASYIPDAYYVDYGKWSKTHAGPVNCESSCAALGKKCIGLYGDETEPILFCSGEKYENVFGTYWDITDSEKTAEKACQSEGGELINGFNGDNYFIGGIALCKECVSCTGGGYVPGDGSCAKKAEENTSDDDEEEPITDDGDDPIGAQGGSYTKPGWGSGGGWEDGANDENLTCTGRFDVTPDSYSPCSSNINIKISWDVLVGGIGIVKCIPSSSVPIPGWSGDLSTSGEISVENISANGNISIGLTCIDSETGITLWEETSEIKEDPLPEIDETLFSIEQTDGVVIKNKAKVNFGIVAIGDDRHCRLSKIDDTSGIYEEVSSVESSRDDYSVLYEGEVSFSRSGDYSFLLVCNNSCNERVEYFSTSVNLPPVKIKSLTVSDEVLQGEGDLQTSVLWEVENAISCSLDGVDMQQKGNSGGTTKVFKYTDGINTVAVLELTCSGYDGSVDSKKVKVSLKYPPIIVKFVAVPSEVNVEESFNFDIETKNADVCLIDGEPVGGDYSGSNPGTFSYELICKNSSTYTASASTDVTVKGTLCVWEKDTIPVPTDEQCKTSEYHGIEQTLGYHAKNEPCIGDEPEPEPIRICGEECVFDKVKIPSDAECISYPGVSQYYEYKATNEPCIGKAPEKEFAGTCPSAPVGE